jgi:hypothetical protein
MLNRERGGAERERQWREGAWRVNGQESIERRGGERGRQWRGGA